MSTMKKKQVEQDYRNRRYQQLKDEILAKKEEQDKLAELERKNQLKEFLAKQVDCRLDFRLRRRSRERQKKSATSEHKVICGSLRASSTSATKIRRSWRNLTT